MDERKLREVYDSIRIEDETYKHLVASALQRRREKSNGKSSRTAIAMRYVLSVASVAFVLTGVILFTSKMPIGHTAASLTTLAQEMTSEAVTEDVTLDTPTEEANTVGDGDAWSVSELIYVNEYSTKLDDLTEAQKTVVFDAFELMEKQELFERANIDTVTYPAKQESACRFFNEVPKKIYYGVPDLYPSPENDVRKELYEKAIEEGIYGSLPFTKLAADRPEPDGFNSLSTLWLVRAQKQIEGVEDGTVLVIKRDSGFFFAEYRTFEDDMMIVSTGYYIGDCTFLEDVVFENSGDTIISDWTGLRTRRIYSEEQREVYVAETMEVHLTPADDSEIMTEFAEGSTVVEFGKYAEWSCVKVNDTIGYVRSEYLSDRIPPTVISDEWIAATEVSDEWIQETEISDEQIPTTEFSGGWAAPTKLFGE